MAFFGPFIFAVCPVPIPCAGDPELLWVDFEDLETALESFLLLCRNTQKDGGIWNICLITSKPVPLNLTPNLILALTKVLLTQSIL